jgi:hypothetical protein
MIIIQKVNPNSIYDNSDDLIEQNCIEEENVSQISDIDSKISKKKSKILYLTSWIDIIYLFDSRIIESNLYL